MLKKSLFFVCVISGLIMHNGYAVAEKSFMRKSLEAVDSIVLGTGLLVLAYVSLLKMTRKPQGF